MRRPLRYLAALSALALLFAACAPEEEADDPVVEPAEDPEPDEEPVEEEPAEEPPVDDQALRLGYVLPETGPLAFLGPAQITPIEMAIEEANDAGGVLGQSVTLLGSDEAGDPTIASESADRLLADGVHAIIGAAASGMSLAIIDQVTGAGVVQCSASNTAPDFTVYQDDGFYFRTAPSDALQGPALAEVILEDGHLDIAILSRADDYGIGLMGAVAASFEEAGGNVVFQEGYDPEQTTFTAEVSEMLAAGPDAIVIIPFDEGVQILQALLEQGWDMGATYGADGIRSTGLNADVNPDDPNAIDGFKGTNPDPHFLPGFLDALQEFAPDLDEFTFSPHAYDCASWIMIAAEAAGTTDPTAIRDNMLDVTRGDNECTSFPECAELLRDGETVAYQFASGTTEMSEVGEPISGRYEIWQWVDGELESLDSREFFAE